MHGMVCNMMKSVTINNNTSRNKSHPMSISDSTQSNSTKFHDIA